VGVVLGMENPRLFAMQLLNDTPVYPGHPTVIAYVIMHLYNGLPKAMERTDWGTPRAVEAPRFPGSGTAVHSALDVLGYVQKGLMSVEDALREADRLWAVSCKDTTSGKHLEGMAQAIAIRGAFVEKANTWLQKGERP
jgi:hypothetical protein